jgi:puromycin-sensitive aminopeptidase
MKAKKQTFSLPVSGANDWLKINAGQQSMVRVSYTPSLLDKLIPAIKSKSLTPVDRAAVLNDAYSLAKAGLGSPEAVVKILTAFESEDNSTVWSVIEGVLTGLNLLLEEIGGESFILFRRLASKMVKNALNVTKWDALPTDGHVEKLLRSTVIGLLDSFCSDDADILREARRRFDGHWENSSLLPSDYKV